MRTADVDNDAVGVKFVGQERGIDHEGRAMQGLRGTKHLALETNGQS